MLCWGGAAPAEGFSAVAPESYRTMVPERFEVVLYLDCGAAKVAQGDGAMTIRRQRGEPLPSGPGLDPSLSMDADPMMLEYRVAGLSEGTDHILGLTWFDEQNRGRRQTVLLNGAPVLADARPIAYEGPSQAQPKPHPYAGAATPARVQFVLPPEHIRDGRMRIQIEKLAGPDAVLSELWIARRAEPAAAKQVLLVSGQDYPGHRWRETGPALARFLAEDRRLEVTVCESPYVLGLSHLDRYDAVFLHFKNYAADLPSTAAMHENLARYLADGGGLGLSHFGCGAMEEWPGFEQWAGRVWNGEGHDPRGPFSVRIVDSAHSITRGLNDFETDDELYFCLRGAPSVRVLCSAFSRVKQADQPQALAYRPGRGRVFLCTLGHDVRAYDAAGVRQLYRQGTAWAAGLDPAPTKPPPQKPETESP